MKKSFVLTIFSVLFLAPAVIDNAFADTWDYSNDFELASPQTGGTGPTPSWFYYFDQAFTSGFSHDGDYDLFSDIVFDFNGRDCFREGPGFYLVCEPSNLGDPGLVHPDGAAAPQSVRQDVVIGFLTPQKGTYHVEGTFNTPDTTSDGVCVSISKHNPSNIGVFASDQNIPQFPPDTAPADCVTNNPIDGVHIGGDAPQTQVSFDFDIDLLCNERLFFRVNPNSNDNANDSTLLSITINDIVLEPQPGDSCEDPPTSDSQLIGGKVTPIQSISLLLAGLQSSMIWILPIVLAGAGFAAFKLRKF